VTDTAVPEPELLMVVLVHALFPADPPDPQRFSRGQVKLSPLLCTLVIWSTITGVSAYSYAVARITSVDAIPGYETTWRFQLLAFAISGFLCSWAGWH